ncbi:hypothetical protein [Parvularcula maris]|uniref:Uncharacterized protein n=1 Tax=Parvularcula maris TaxID=2965077 RepID=A0A9X2LB59_9PROT|nr:hypothetical protein [Parvularcula maris]MCQ8186486.1 hypothetical protein [Parvularcula maris]
MSARLSSRLKGSLFGVLALLASAAEAQVADGSEIVIPMPYAIEEAPVDTSALVTFAGVRFDDVAWERISGERPFRETRALNLFIRAIEARDLDTLRRLVDPELLIRSGGSIEQALGPYLSTWNLIELQDVLALFTYGDRATFVLRGQAGSNTVLPVISFKILRDGKLVFVIDKTDFLSQIVSGWSTRGAVALTGGADVDSLFADGDTAREFEVPLLPSRDNDPEIGWPVLSFDGSDPDTSNDEAAFVRFVEEAQELVANGELGRFVDLYAEDSASVLRQALQSTPLAGETLAQFAEFELLFVMDAEPLIVAFFSRPGDALQPVFAQRTEEGFEFVNAASVYSVLNALVSPNMVTGAFAEPAFGQFEVTGQDQ